MASKLVKERRRVVAKEQGCWIAGEESEGVVVVREDAGYAGAVDYARLVGGWNA